MKSRGAILCFCSLGFLSFVPMAYGQYVLVRAAEPVSMPSRADSSSPTYWRGSELRIINSTGTPMLSRGAAADFQRFTTEQIQLSADAHLGMWIESVWQDADGTIYGWYHHEPPGVCGSDSKMTAPEIGAVASDDGGRSFVDLGIVLSSGDALNCHAGNGLFAGGHGDFSVILDRSGSFFYFLFGNYGGSTQEQGIALARLAFEDRGSPVGSVWKYYDGAWDQPGIGGRVTPVFPAVRGWQESNTDSFWGPSIHWNTYLESHIVLLNHSCCAPNWPQEGIYLTGNLNLADPTGWSVPKKILGKVNVDAGYYPQVLGNDGADTVAGQVARLFVEGHSAWEVVFSDTPFADEGPAPRDPTEKALASPRAKTRRGRRK